VPSRPLALPQGGGELTRAVGTTSSAMGSFVAYQFVEIIGD
jgi:hypothetical protein